MLYQSDWSIDTAPRSTHDITAELQKRVVASGIENGLCTLFLHHTSASLILCENADPDVRHDLETYFAGLVEDGDRRFRHVAEGDDDMPAHIRTVLTQNSIGLPVRGGRCDLGTWQGLYVWEHRTQRHRRRISMTLLGD